MDYDVNITVTLDVIDAAAVQAAAWRLLAASPEGTDAFADEVTSTIEGALTVILSSRELADVLETLRAGTPGLGGSWGMSVPVDGVAPTPPTIRTRPRVTKAG